MTIEAETLKDLKRAYNRAVKNEQETFDFQGDELVTAFAKYLIEYLEMYLL